MALLQRFVGGVIADALRESVMRVDAGVRISQSGKKNKSPEGGRNLGQRVTPEVGSSATIEGFLAVPLTRHRLHGPVLDCTIKPNPPHFFQARYHCRYPHLGASGYFLSISIAPVPALEYFCLILRSK